LTDSCWEQAAQAASFTRTTDGSAPEARTTVRVCYDEAGLYFGFTCEEPSDKSVRAFVTERDGNVASDDAVEIFLNPRPDRGHFFHFAVNARGARFDERWDGADIEAGWDALWSAAGSFGPKQWHVEVALPFAALELHQPMGQAWGLNFLRRRCPVREVSTWAPLTGSPYQPARFGTLTGLELRPERFRVGVEVASWGEGSRGENRVEVAVINATGRAVTLEARLQFEAPNGTRVSRPPQLVPLAVDGKRRLILPYVAAEEGTGRLTLELREQETGLLVWAREQTIQVEGTGSKD